MISGKQNPVVLDQSGQNVLPGHAMPCGGLMHGGEWSKGGGQQDNYNTYHSNCNIAATMAVDLFNSMQYYVTITGGGTTI